MCTHNGALHLSEQLQSLTSQLRPPDEVVICDDCSTDETQNVLIEFARHAPFQVNLTFNKRNLGSTRNFEQAIQLCQGDVIALCDQDDCWLPEKLQLFAERFDKDPSVSLLFCDAELVDEAGKVLGQRLWAAAMFDPVMKSKIRSELAYEIFDRRELIAGMTMAFRSSFKGLVLPFPEKTPLIHDGWIALMISHAGRVDFIERPLVNYRQHPSQQLGAPDLETKSKSIITKVLNSAGRKTGFSDEINKVQAVLDRMDSLATSFEFKGRQNLEAISNHFQLREAISQEKVRHLPAIFRELLAGNYHRYSKGFGSFLKDLST